MEVLNAAATAVPPSGALKVTSHSETKSGTKSKAFLKKSMPTSSSPPSFTNYAENLFRAFGSQLKITPIHPNPAMLFSSFFSGAQAASALTYEEALQQGVTSSPTEAPVDFDLSGITDSVLSFTSENSLAVAAGVVAVGVPLALIRILSKPKTWGTISAADAYSKLSEDPQAGLLDIRTSEDIKEEGSPDVRRLKKRAVQIVYGDDASFLEKVTLKFKDPSITTLYIMDKFDGNSAKVAKLLAENGFKLAFAIKDGAEGPRGWQNSGLPWLFPRKAFTFDIGNLTEALGSAMEDSSGLVPVTVGVAAATGVGLAAFSEIETVLQLLGSAALIQIFLKKLLFAEDRKRTIQQVQEFLDTKVAPKELVDELKEIGKALLPKTIDVATNNDAVVPQSQQADGPVTVAVSAEDKKQESTNSTPVTVSSGTDMGGNSVPQPAMVDNATVPSPSKTKYLSPYPHYPDFKPPTSPMPSRP